MTTPLTTHQRVLAVGLVLGVTLVAFETTAVITALPTITDELGGDSLYGVALAAYTLANLVALVVSGELSDRRGPVVPFVLSISTFIVGLIVAAAATSMPIVVVGRLLQGAGTGGYAPIAYVLVRRAFPEDRQPMMYAVMSAGWVLPSLVAPAFAGLVTEHFGWRWVFLCIIPVAVAVGALASQPMRKYPPVEDIDRRSTRVPSALLAAAGVGMFVTGLRLSNLFAAIGIAGAGVAIALPSLRRLLPTGVGRARRGLPAVLGCRLLAMATFLGADSFIPLAADRVHHVSATTQGFVIIGAALSWSAGSWAIAKRTDIEARRATRWGFTLLVIGLALVAPVLWDGWPLWATFISWMVGGLGMGLIFNPTTVTAMSYTENGKEGEVSSQLQVCDALGFSVMSGIGGSMVAIADRTSLADGPAIGIVFAVAALLAGVGIIASRGVQPSGAPAMRVPAPV